MGKIQQSRWGLAFAAFSVILEWAGPALKDGKVSKAEINDLTTKILALVGMNLKDIA